jgi:hypothetical protein
VSLAIAAIALGAAAVAAVVYMARQLAAARQAELDARASEANLRVADADASAQLAAAAVARQEKRGDALEKELSDDEATPIGSGRDRLRQLAGVPAPGDPGGGRGTGKS